MARRARWRSRARAFFSSWLAGRPTAEARPGPGYRSSSIARPRMHVPFFSTVHASPARARLCAWNWELGRRARLHCVIWSFGPLEAGQSPGIWVHMCDCSIYPCKYLFLLLFFIFLSISGDQWFHAVKLSFNATFNSAFPFVDRCL
jgi:hypothetical protein